MLNGCFTESMYVFCVKVAHQVASLGEHEVWKVYAQNGRLDLRSDF